MELDLKPLPRILVALLAIAPALSAAQLNVVVIEGLGGEERYAEDFALQVDQAERAAATMTDQERIAVFRAAEVSRERILDHFESLGSTLGDGDRLAVYLIGHGSYDDHEYKFNIAGPDLTGADLAGMLDGVAVSDQVIVNTSSASGAVLDSLESDGRIVIVATRSGVERHATRFGAYFAGALDDPGADLDKDRVITAQEAFDFAARQVTDFFENNGQLATEHARMSGEHASRFGLSRLEPRRPDVDDPELNEMIAVRDALAARIDELRQDRGDMNAEDYRSQLLEHMLELALLEEEIEQRRGELSVED